MPEEVEQLEVEFWGTRGSIPSPGKNTVKYGGNATCVELILNDNTLIVFDAGTGIKNLGQKIIKKVFDFLIANPAKLPEYLQNNDDPLEVKVCDYIAGMTDSFVREFTP